MTKLKAMRAPGLKALMSPFPEHLSLKTPIHDDKKPYLLFLGDAPDDLAAKVAQGIKDWRPENVIGKLSLPSCQAQMDLPEMSLAVARRLVWKP